jgi:PEP-CTERM motif
MRFIHAIATVTALAALTGGANAATQVFNFTNVPSLGSYVYAPTGTGADFTGNAGLQNNAPAWGFAPSPDGLTAAFIQTGDPLPGAMSITFSGLTNGANYALSFQTTSRPGYGGDAFDVSGQGITWSSSGAPSTLGWTPVTINFTASGTSESVSFMLQDSYSSVGDRAIGVDQISLSVPEPATWATMLMGFFGLGFAGYRRRQSGGARAAA